MALMVVAHPDPTFTGRVAVEDVGLVFVGGFTGPTDVPTEVQAQLTAEGFTLNATPGANYGGRYILDTDLEDDDSEAMVILRAAFGTLDGIGNATVFLGDSLTSSGAGGTLPGARWPEVVTMRSKGRIKWTRNSGIGNNTTAQMLARLSTDVLAYNPRFCVVLGGTNDADTATAITGLTNLYTALRAAGVEPIAVALPPRNSDAGGRANQVNAWIKRYAQAHRINVVDVYPALVNPTTGQYAAGLGDGDGIHLTAAGDDAVATAVLAAIQPLYPAWTPYLAPSQVDSANLVPNPLLIDTRLAGDGVTPIPEDPLGWVSFDGGGTSSRAMVTVAGVPGRMHELTIPSTTPGAFTVSQYTPALSDSFPIPVTAGHTVRFSLRVQTENAMVNGVKMSAMIEFNNSGGSNGLNQSSAGEVADGVWSQDVLVPVGSTAARVLWGASAPTSGVSTTKLWFGQPTVVDLG